MIAENNMQMTEHGLVTQFLEHVAGIGSPKICLEEDGELAFDWHKATNCTITASLNSSGRIGWSALLPHEKGHGHFTLPSWSKDLQHMLNVFRDTTP